VNISLSCNYKQDLSSLHLRWRIETWAPHSHTLREPCTTTELDITAALITVGFGWTAVMYLTAGSELENQKMIGAGPNQQWRSTSLSVLAKNRQWFWVIAVGSGQEPMVITSQYKKLASSSPSSSLPSQAQRCAFGPLPPLLRLLFTMKLALGFGKMGWSSCF
jgi:hypothetical protein